MTVSEKLARFVAETAYDHLPSAIVAEVKLRVLDILGAIAAGSVTQAGSAMTGAWRSPAGFPGEATVIPGGSKLPWSTAILVNTSVGGCAEIDDIHPHGIVRIGAMVVPAALAMAEKTGCRGQEFITAVAAGYEVATRCSLAVSGAKLLAKGWWPSASLGPLGAAAAAAKAAGYDRKVIADALGIAGVLAGGLISGDSTAKHILFGRAAQNGAEAAYMAGEGFTGPANIFEGDRGLFASRGLELNAEALVDKLGERYLFPGTAIKVSPCAMQLQSTVAAFGQIMDSRGLKADDLRSVRVRLPARAMVVVRGGPPANHHVAVASAPFVLAMAALHGLISVEHFTEANLHDERVQRLMALVGVQTDDGLEQAAGWPAVVTVETTDGNLYTQEVREWVSRELIEKQKFVTAKFLRITNSALNEKTAVRVIEAVEGLEKGGIQGILAVFKN